MHTATAKQHAKPKLYNPRHPEHTLLYRTVAEHFETWLELASAGQFDSQGDPHVLRHHAQEQSRSPSHIMIINYGMSSNDAP